MFTRLCAPLLALVLAGPPAGETGGEWEAGFDETGLDAFDPAPPLWEQPGGFWLSVEMLGPRGAQLDAARSLVQPPVLEALPRGGVPPPGELVGRVDTLEQALAWVAGNLFGPVAGSTTPIPGGRLLAEFELIQTALVVTGPAIDGTTPYAWPPAIELPVPDGWQAASLTAARVPVFAAPAPTHPPITERYRVATLADAIWLLGKRDSCALESGSCLAWAQIVVRQGDRFFGGWIPASWVAPDSAWIGGPGERRFALLPGHRTPSEAGFVLHEQRGDRREAPVGIRHPHVARPDSPWPAAGVDVLGEELLVIIDGKAVSSRQIEAEPQGPLLP